MDEAGCPSIFYGGENTPEVKSIREQTIEYLNYEGDNPKLARGIEYHARHFRYCEGANLSRLTRIAGPEPNMPYRAGEAKWEATVAKYAEEMAGGDSFPPLIVIDFGVSEEPCGKLWVADGNKRHEAKTRSGVKTGNVVFCLQYDPRIYNL